MACLLTVSAVAGNSSDTTRTDAATAQGSRLHRWLQVGQASWYGKKFQGHKTATGERYDMNELTCAHRSLPLGSWIRVTNLHNRRSIFVRVNDRGPMIGKRIIDLSYAAAHAVGLDGIGKVRLEAVTTGDAELAQALVAQNATLALRADALLDLAPDVTTPFVSTASVR